MVGHVVAKENTFFLLRWHRRKHLVQAVINQKYNNIAEKANLFALHYLSDCTFLLSSTLKLTLRSYKSILVGFIGYWTILRINFFNRVVASSIFRDMPTGYTTRLHKWIRRIIQHPVKPTCTLL